jgi:hypothetical protein
VGIQVAWVAYDLIDLELSNSKILKLELAVGFCICFTEYFFVSAEILAWRFSFADPKYREHHLCSFFLRLLQLLHNFNSLLKDDFLTPRSYKRPSLLIFWFFPENFYKKVGTSPYLWFFIILKLLYKPLPFSIWQRIWISYWSSY